MRQMNPAGYPNHLVARGLSDHDPEMINLLVEEHHDNLFRYLQVLTRDWQMAEDLCQETWLRVLERGNQYNGESNFRTWLFAIARHLFLDHLRRKKQLSLEAMMDCDRGYSEPAANTSPSALDLICRLEQQRRLRAQIRRLSPGCRRLVSLRVEQNRGLAEIAAMTNIPLSRVKSRLYRALSILQTRLSPQPAVT